MQSITRQFIFAFSWNLSDWKWLMFRKFEAVGNSLNCLRYHFDFISLLFMTATFLNFYLIWHENIGFVAGRDICDCHRWTVSPTLTEMLDNRTGQSTTFRRNIINKQKDKLFNNVLLLPLAWNANPENLFRKFFIYCRRNKFLLEILN
jgi:hypothetical protein